MKRLVLVELNEINFDIVELYINSGYELPGFSFLIKKNLIKTKSEIAYNELEPWIQWVSVHTGKKFSEHNVYRLGDFVNSNHDQFFEIVERAGFSVGAVSPMNASNKLQNPAYFIPDPWTQTTPDNSFFSKRITEAIQQAVNDNAHSKITIKTLFNLMLAFFALINPKRYLSMIIYAFQAMKKPWKKALFLDMFLFEVHKSLFARKKPNFSTIFLNAGAHIQHHYFFNSPYVENNLKNPSWYIDKKEDPFLDMLKVYDEMIKDLIDTPDIDFIVATGLSQKPFKKLKFYYRLNNHNFFLDLLGIKYKDVIPRMTRDFLISFNSTDDAINAEKILSNLLVNKETRLFGEIDNRGKDIFVVLTYPLEINDETKVYFSDNVIFLKNHVSFVAIKNGEHQGKGFAYFSEGLSEFTPPSDSHVSKIHDSILNFFNISLVKSND